MESAVMGVRSRLSVSALERALCQPRGQVTSSWQTCNVKVSASPAPTQQPKYFFSTHLSMPSSTTLPTTTRTPGNTFNKRFIPTFPARKHTNTILCGATPWSTNTRTAINAAAPLLICVSSTNTASWDSMSFGSALKCSSGSPVR